MNVLLVIVDTLRADHLGCFGYARRTSPNIDALAASGVVCERLFAASIPTHPAFVTMCTGQYPITHGVVAHGGRSEVPRTAPWLPEVMRKNHYTTCAIDNLAESRLGFGKGYEFYIDPTRNRPLHINADNRMINDRAIPWLEQHKTERFFTMVHYWDPHTPYLPPRAYRTLFYQGDPCDPDNHSLDGMEAHPLGRMWRETWFTQLGGHITDAEYITALYDGEIRYCDEGIGKLLKTLRKLGLDENTLVVLTSDHGELMYRHKVFFDHHGLYDGNLHVPLILRHPDLAPRRVPHLAANVDLAPTVLGLCGVDIPAEMEGINLAPLIRGESDAPVRDSVVSEECTWQMKWAIRTETHKFIRAREPDFYGTPMRELYDLCTDPDELRNIADQDRETAQALEARLEAWISDKMRQNRLTEDPLARHGITLGKCWQQERAGAGHAHQPKQTEKGPIS